MHDYQFDEQSDKFIIIMRSEIDLQQKDDGYNNDARGHYSKNEDGFSCDDQLQDQIVYEVTDDWKQLNEIDDERVKMKIGPVREISTKSYSLEPDMISGWAPKNSLCRPVPLTFQNWYIDGLIDYYLKFAKGPDKHKIKLAYLGARYETTYYAWYQKKFEFPYKHLNAPRNIKITDRFLCGQHWDAQNADFLLFDSIFEGGNLDAAFKVGEFQYDLFMRVDSNTQGHIQWFNFKVKNFRAEKTYKFNLCNFQKGKSLYSRGMAPYFYSRKRFINSGIQWSQLDAQCSYRKKISKTQKILDFQNDQCNYMLTFNFKVNDFYDQVQFSYCVPYNYSNLMNKMKTITEKFFKYDFVKVKKLCLSLGGNQIPEITFTQDCAKEEEFIKKKKKMNNKKVVIITGRCHPGESNGSWMVDGLIDFLCTQSEEADYLRKKLVIKIIPMLNPDGVILGNYRTGLSGRDFNRQFVNPDKDIFPEIYHLKQLLKTYRQVYREQVLFYFDFHGHSIKKNVFAYGPQYSIIHKNYYESRMILKLISSKTDMFRYHSCIFKISEQKQKTGRAVCQRNIKIPFAYTIQASNGTYFDHQQLKNEPFDAQKWAKTGQSVLKGVFQYMKILEELESIRTKKLRQRQLLRNRVKKQKNNILPRKSGTYTSLGFRKLKQSVSSQEQIFSFASMMKDIPVKQQRFSSLVEEIRQQSSSKQQQIFVSDDQISEGGSDSQKSADNLCQEELASLYKILKRKNGNANPKMKFKDKKYTNIQQTKTNYNQQLSQQQNSQRCEKGRGITQKESNFRRYFWKKKNSMCTTPSPKKQQSGTAAKIVNFSFSLRPTDTGLAGKSCVAEKKIQKPDKIGQNQGSYTDLSFAKRSSKSYEYSDTFKRSFVSVQKQILRRQTHKRYLVTVNNSLNQNKSKPNYLIENSHSKRVNTDII